MSVGYEHGNAEPVDHCGRLTAVLSITVTVLVEEVVGALVPALSR